MMKSPTLVASAMLLAALQACTPAPMTAQTPVQRERLAYLNQTSEIPVTCTAGMDCAEKWRRALEWINVHSTYSIKSSTNSEIVTNEPAGPTTDSAFIVSRSPETAEEYIINFSSSCGKAQDCVPSSLVLHSEFNNFLLSDIRNGNF